MGIRKHPESDHLSLFAAHQMGNHHSDCSEEYGDEAEDSLVVSSIKLISWSCVSDVIIHRFEIT